MRARSGEPEGTNARKFWAEKFACETMNFLIWPKDNTLPGQAALFALAR